MAKSSLPEPHAATTGSTTRKPSATARAAALILASGSRYRAELLGRLRVPFATEASEIDETPAAGEDIATLVQRLADRKAEALAARHPDHWILGSDQSAALDGIALGKPGSVERAHEQLTACSGRAVQFFTAVTLMRGRQHYRALDITTVRFRTLSSSEISQYIAVEPALDCAGSFKCEAYGITLFDAIETQDPTALVGLPLIATARLLRSAGFQLP